MSIEQIANLVTWWRGLLARIGGLLKEQRPRVASTS